jgi:hypothetical protein
MLNIGVLIASFIKVAICLRIFSKLDFAALDLKDSYFLLQNGLHFELFG